MQNRLISRATTNNKLAFSYLQSEEEWKTPNHYQNNIRVTSNTDAFPKIRALSNEFP